MGLLDKLKKLPKLALAGTVCLTTMLNNSAPIHAAGNTSLKYMDGWSMAGEAYGQGAMLYRDGEHVYCIEPGVGYPEGVSYGIHDIDKTLSQTLIKKLSHISYYGYGYSGRTDKKWAAATQNLIWEKVLGYRRDYIQVSGESMTSLENQIMDDVNDYYTKPSFDSNSYTLDIGESITLTDTKGILSKYNVKSSDGLSVTKSGNKLTITATASAKDNSEIILSNVPSSKQGDSIMYWDGVAGHQKTAVFLVNDPTFAYIDVKVNKYGSLKLAKIDEDGNKVAGTSFKVSKNEDMSSSVGTYTTGEDGTVTANELLPGKYYIQETKVPNHLILDNTIHSVTIEANKTATYTATNKWKQGKLKLRKFDSKNGKQIEGATYGIYNEQNQELQRLVTRATGYAESGYLRFGNYYVKEIASPEGYVLNSTKYPVTVSENEEVITINAEDKPIEGYIEIKKKDSLNGASIGGAIYGIYDADGKEVQQLTTKAGTYVRSKALTYGSYTIKEIVAPEGYVLSTRTYNATIKTEDQNSQVTVEDKPIEGYIQVVKKDSKSGKTIVKAHTVFEVYRASDDSFIDTITTNSAGKAKTDLLRYGDYYLKEKTAPYGYAYSETKIKYQIREEGKTYTAEFANVRTPGKIMISKEDSKTGKQPLGDATLANAIYGIYAKDNILDPADGEILYKPDDKVATMTTDADGNASKDGLYLGAYYIKEITPSKGYTLDTTTYNVILDYVNQSEAIITKKQTVLERVKAQAFELIKISDHGSGETDLLECAEFTIKLKADVNKAGSWDKAPIAKNAEGKTVAIMKTDQKGYALSDELPYGEYIVRETKVPDEHYRIDDFTVIIKEDKREPQTWRIFNDKKFHAVISIIKQDAQTQKTIAVSGATFKIKNLDTNSYFGYWEWNPFPHYVDSWTSDESGTVMTGDVLEPGNYQLEETNAPKPYLVNTTPVKFKVSSNVAYETLPDGTTPVICIIMKDISVKGKISVEKQGEVLTDVKKDGKGNVQFVYETRKLPNAQFAIFAKEDIFAPDNSGTLLYKKNQLVESIKTDKNGMAHSNLLPLGNYMVKEQQAPEGFIQTNEVHDVSLQYETQEVPIVFALAGMFENKRQKVHLDVQKLDKDTKQPLANAEFKLYAMQDIVSVDGKMLIRKDECIETATSSKDGKVPIISDLPLSMYKLKETKAPIGYVSTNFEEQIDAHYQGQDIPSITYKAFIENEITEVEVAKKDITNDEEIEGAQMMIYPKDEPGAVFATWISGQDGKDDKGKIKPHIVKGLQPNTTYILHEISSPHGYALAQDVEFEIKDSGDLQFVEMKDELVLGQLVWEKTGEIFMSTVTGQCEFGKTESPVWETSNLLHAEITIYAAEDIKIGNTLYYHKDEKVESLESDWDEVASKHLVCGAYYYMETKTPHGYVKDVRKHYFMIEDAQTTKLQIHTSSLYNERPHFTLNMTKLLEQQEVFKNEDAYLDVLYGIYAREDIYDYMGKVAIPNGTLLHTSGIDKTGKLENMIDLPNGVYYVKELKTNAQYVLDEKEYDFEIGWHGEDVVNYVVHLQAESTLENKLARGSLLIHKVDSENKNQRMKNVTFRLSDKKDMSHILKEQETDENGYAHFANLELGMYYVQEKEQVVGYTLNDHIYQAKVAKHGDVLEIRIENVPVKMRFDKIDEKDKKHLKGAILQILDKQNGQVIAEWTSDGTPYTVMYLEEGKNYVFHEVYAPKNYQKADDITFTAKHNKTIVMKDEKIKVKHNVVTMDASLRRDFLMLCSITSLCVLCMLRKRKRNLD